MKIVPLEWPEPKTVVVISIIVINDFIDGAWIGGIALFGARGFASPNAGMVAEEPRSGQGKVPRVGATLAERTREIAERAAGLGLETVPDDTAYPTCSACGYYRRHAPERC